MPPGFAGIRLSKFGGVALFGCIGARNAPQTQERFWNADGDWMAAGVPETVTWVSRGRSSLVTRRVASVRRKQLCSSAAELRRGFQALRATLQGTRHRDPANVKAEDVGAPNLHYSITCRRCYHPTSRIVCHMLRTM